MGLCQFLFLSPKLWNILHIKVIFLLTYLVAREPLEQSFLLKYFNLYKYKIYIIKIYFNIEYIHIIKIYFNI